jgi:[protein-PII] uridylyltransferase
VQVGDHEHLDHLYLLTIADIAGTNPKLWNEWKARLLADLHMAARYVLRADLGRPSNAGERAADCRARTRELLVEGGAGPAEAERWLDAFPQSSFLRHRPAQLARQARAIAAAGPDGVVVAVNPQSARGGSELFVCAPDRDGLFAAIAATLDRQGLGVVDARLLVGAGGRVFDTFQLLDERSGNALAPARARELETALRRVLEARELVTRVARRTLPRRLRHFQRMPQVEFADVEGATQLALVCSDRPGLLAEVAQALREARVRVHDARIATFGERVEDFFVLTDETDAVLTEAARQRLRARLLERLGADSP